MGFADVSFLSNPLTTSHQTPMNPYHLRENADKRFILPMPRTFNTRLLLILTAHHSPDRFSEGVLFEDKCFMPLPSSLDGRPGGEKPTGGTEQPKDDERYRVRQERELVGGEGCTQ